jgi:PAS domain S-box-containing protein
MNKTRTRVGIIGGGRGCHELLTMMQADPLRLGIEVLGVADPDPDSPGLCLARELGVPLIVDDYHEFFVRSDIEVVIELTGITEVRDEIFRNLPPHIHIVDHHASRFFWDLFARAEESRQLEKRSARELERKDAQLDVTKRTLQEVLTNSRDIIFLADATGKLVTVNSGAEQALGCHRDELIGKPVRDLAAQPEVFDELWQATIADGHATQYEVVLNRCDGESITVNIGMSLTGGGGDEGSEVIGICRDITTRLRLQQEIFRTEQLAAIGKMAAGVAHEINNPLAVIDTIAGVIEDNIAECCGEIAPEKHAEMTAAVARLRLQVKRAVSITHSLLGFVRQSRGGPHQVDLAKLTDETLNLLAPEISRGDVTVRRDYAEPLPQPLIDPQLVQQVLVNLMKNALDAIEESDGRQGVLTVGLAPAGDGVTVTVQDNGVGIPAADLERIFELFHTSKPAGKGTGLGLAIVQDITKRIGATVHVDSEPGRGTRFTLELPPRPPAPQDA